MDEEIERLIVSVRADTAGFRRDVADMRAELEGPLAEGSARAGRLLETALVSAVRTGKLGFEDMKRVALSAMAQIAASAIRGGIGSATGGGAASLGSLIGGLLGLPGRATGGPVEQGRAYLVGERGPELFLPAASGRVEPLATPAAREVRISISVSAPAGGAPQALEQSSRQVARAVRQALMRVD